MLKKKAHTTPTEAARRCYAAMSLWDDSWNLHEAVKAVCIDVDDEVSSKYRRLFNEAAKAIAIGKIKGRRLTEDDVISEPHPAPYDLEKLMQTCAGVKKLSGISSLKCLHSEGELNKTLARENRLYLVAPRGFVEWAKSKGFDTTIFGQEAPKKRGRPKGSVQNPNDTRVRELWVKARKENLRLTYKQFFDNPPKGVDFRAMGYTSARRIKFAVDNARH